MGVVVRRYIDFLILLILYLFFFAAVSLLFCSFKKMFFVLYNYVYRNFGYLCGNIIYANYASSCEGT